MDNRIYVRDLSLYGYHLRTMMGLSGSSVVLCDNGGLYGFAGGEVARGLVDPAKEACPTDFREVGISVLTEAGVNSDDQARMFTNFIKDYTAKQRGEYVAAYDALDKTDSSAVASFISNMMTVLLY